MVDSRFHRPHGVFPFLSTARSTESTVRSTEWTKLNIFNLVYSVVRAVNSMDFNKIERTVDFVDLVNSVDSTGDKKVEVDFVATVYEA